MHLGVALSGTCKWGVHIENIIISVSKSISVLRKLKYMLNRDTLSKLYNVAYSLSWNILVKFGMGLR